MSSEVTFFFAFVLVGRTDNVPVAVEDNYALDVLVRLNAVKCFLDFRHSSLNVVIIGRLAISVMGTIYTET